MPKRRAGSSPVPGTDLLGLQAKITHGAALVYFLAQRAELGFQCLQIFVQLAGLVACQGHASCRKSLTESYALRTFSLLPCFFFKTGIFCQTQSNVSQRVGLRRFPNEETLCRFVAPFPAHCECSPWLPVILI